MKATVDDVVLFVNDAHGQYVPQVFAKSIGWETVSGVKQEEIDILLAGPDHPDYCEVWDDVIRNATVLGKSGRIYHLYQDGDLWMIPEGIGINVMGEFVPKEEADEPLTPFDHQ